MIIKITYDFIGCIVVVQVRYKRIQVSIPDGSNPQDAKLEFFIPVFLVCFELLVITPTTAARGSGISPLLRVVGDNTNNGGEGFRYLSFASGCW